MTIKSFFKEQFSFLIDKYEFEYIYKSYNSAVNKENKFYFHGPMNAFSLYNKKGCITFFHLVQRDEWDVYVVDKYSESQADLKKGKYYSNGYTGVRSKTNKDLKYNDSSEYLENLAILMKLKLKESNNIFDIDVNN